jgi:hypothetical protein
LLEANSRPVDFSLSATAKHSRKTVVHRSWSSRHSISQKRATATCWQNTGRSAFLFYRIFQKKPLQVTKVHLDLSSGYSQAKKSPSFTEREFELLGVDQVPAFSLFFEINRDLMPSSTP